MHGRHREIPQLFNDLRTSLFVTYFTGSFYSSRKILLSVKITLSLSLRVISTKRHSPSFNDRHAPPYLSGQNLPFSI